MAKRYWLMKSEPNVYSLDDLKREGSTCWEGVRNYQARNFMRDDMSVGDGVLYYHSRVAPIGIAGLARVCKESYPDHEQFDQDSKYYDPKATEEKPRWFMVDLEYVRHFAETLSLEQLKEADNLDGMLVTQKGQRLSIQPVEQEHWVRVCEMAGVSPEI